MQGGIEGPVRRSANPGAKAIYGSDRDGADGADGASGPSATTD